MENRTSPTISFVVLGAGLLLAPSWLQAAEVAMRQPDALLDEVLVEGQRQPIKDSQTVIDWLARLVGRFDVTGEITLYGKDDAIDVRESQGSAVCTGYGLAPAVQCELKIRWPTSTGSIGNEILKAASTLDPATMLLGLEPTQTGITHLLVDSKGIAEGAVGLLLTNDFMMSVNTCAGIPGECARRVLITAPNDLKSVELQIELHLNYELAAIYTFDMSRIPGPPPVYSPGAK